MKNVTRLFLLVLAIASPAVQAAGKCKTISKLPYEVTASGVYCLKKDLSYVNSDGTSITTNSDAITISAPNTVLDLEGFTLSNGSSPTDTLAVGVKITADNVTVRNGRINNFLSGVSSASSPTGLLIENLALAGNRSTGINLDSTYSLVRNNVITSTGGATYAANAPAYGIFIFGDDTTIAQNIIVQVTSVGTGNAAAVAISDFTGGRNRAIGNMISNINSPSGADAGIWFLSGGNNIASDNLITLPGGIGIDFDGTGPYMGNLVQGSTSSDYSGGSAQGSTNF